MEAFFIEIFRHSYSHPEHVITAGLKRVSGRERALHHHLSMLEFKKVIGDTVEAEEYRLGVMIGAWGVLRSHKYVEARDVNTQVAFFIKSNKKMNINFHYLSFEK